MKGGYMDIGKRIRSRMLVFMLAFAVVFTYSVMPVNQAYAASKKPGRAAITKVAAISSSSVRVTWKKTSNAKNYQIWVSPKKLTGYKKAATVKGTKRTCDVAKYNGKALKAKTKYYFKVRAVNGSKTGKYSKVRAAVTKKKPAKVKTKTVYVTPQWLNSALAGQQKGYEKVVVCEVAYDNGDSDSAKKARKKYADGHVPGAIRVFSTEVEDATGTAGRYKAYNLLSVSDIRKNLVKKGITADTKVVLYDVGGDPCEVGRQAYGYIVAGVKDVKILNGDLAAWKKAGFKAEKKKHTRKKAKSFGKAKKHLEYWTSTETAKAKLGSDPNFKAVSIRSENEWLGKTSGYGYIPKAGEPEGAVWGKGAKTAFDVADFVNKDGTVKKLSAMKAIWADCNFKTDGSQHLAFYCGTGWRATVPFLRLYESGFTNMSVLDGGWYEWIMHDDYPVQVGDPASPNCIHTTVGKLPKEAAKAKESFVDIQKNKKDEWAEYGIQYDGVDLKKDFILDVRDDTNYTAGHFIGSVRVDVTSNDKSIYGPGLDKVLTDAGDKRIVVICNTGNALAARALEYYRSGGKIENVKITYLIGGAANTAIPKSDPAVWEPVQP